MAVAGAAGAAVAEGPGGHLSLRSHCVDEGLIVSVAPLWFRAEQ